MTDTSFDGRKSFLAVAELHSFTAAAARLGVTSTAVSEAVKLLELHNEQAFVPSTSGLFLYVPGRMRQQPKLRAFIGIAVAEAAALSGDAFFSE